MLKPADIENLLLYTTNNLLNYILWSISIQSRYMYMYVYKMPVLIHLGEGFQLTFSYKIMIKNVEIQPADE